MLPLGIFCIPFLSAICFGDGECDDVDRGEGGTFREWASSRFIRRTYSAGFRLIETSEVDVGGERGFERRGAMVEPCCGGVEEEE